MNYFEEALKLANSQASVRLMTDTDILAMVESLATGLKSIHEKFETAEVSVPAEVIEPVAPVEESAAAVSAQEVKKSIKANSIVCLECGKVMKVLGNRHLATHGLDANAYREKYGIKKNIPLCAKELVKARREKMSEMRLWERKGKKEEE